jgi:hypothetical protein
VWRRALAPTGRPHRVRCDGGRLRVACFGQSDCQACGASAQQWNEWPHAAPVRPLIVTRRVVQGCEAGRVGLDSFACIDVSEPRGGRWLGLVQSGLWHLPLFYSAGTVQSHLPLGLFALSAIASSVLFAWLFNRTEGSVLPVLVLHTAVNAWSSVILVMVLPDGSNLRSFQWVVGILVVAALLLFRGGRSRRPAQPHFRPGPELLQLRRARWVSGHVAVPT